MRKLRLKRGEERKILEDYLWAFSNQVEDPLRDFKPGEVVRVTTRGGKFLGVGYVNPHSLIACRVLTKEEREIDTDFLIDRFKAAQRLRQRILPGERAVREIYSESDFLPGLIVDRYGEILVVSITTAGMDNLRTQVVDTLNEVYKPLTIYERSDLSFRKLEGIEEKTGLLSGSDLPEELLVDFAGLKLPVDIINGQKTGLYLDQRKNIEIAAPTAADLRVLDAFCYTGAWGLKAAKAGAEKVTFVDASVWAIGQAEKTTRRLRIKGRCEFIQKDALTAIKQLAAKKRCFDLVFLDPPSFIKSRARFKEGYRGYFDLNQKALSLIEPGGILVTSSCSHHMYEDTFLDLIKSVLRRNNREGRILYKGRQSPDHPVLPAMPETEYLHCIAIQVN
jgi:23S rRNA (cytosine1962-C5)-methyltransferase